MRKTFYCVTALAMLVFSSGLMAAPVEFTLLTHGDNSGRLPQPSAVPGVSGDHLIQTSDDITYASYNPDGCFSFNFTNPVGEWPPDYPPGYAEGIHSMTGSLVLDVDLTDGGTVGVNELAYNGFITSSKTAYQHLVKPGDPGADGNHGPVNGQPNSGAYSASADSDWAFSVSIDWYYDTPFQKHPSIDMTFNDYAWDGFLVPVAELTSAGMEAAVLDDHLGYFGGTSEDFESWLLNEVEPRLPASAQYLLFAQGEAHPDWTHPMMGMTTDGLVGETIVAYTEAVVPEPGTALVLGLGLWMVVLRCRISRR